MRIFFMIILLLFPFLSLVAQGGKDFRVIAYFSGRPSQLDSFDVDKITHLIYCFGHLKGNRFHLDHQQDTLMIRKMVGLKKKNPALKVMLSLGGWGGCAPCADVFATHEGRAEFARSFRDLSRYLKTDGIDLDWEYPVVEGYPGHKYGPEDKDHFTALVQELRQTLDKGALVTFAAGGFQKFLEESIDWKKVVPLVDFVNLMTYDLVNGYATTTGHHTALYSTPQQKESTDNAVQYLLRIGVPARKLVIGAAFYGRIWENVPGESNGLYQPGKFKAAESFQSLSTTATANGYVYHWDDTAKAPYLYHPEKKLFVTYDDLRSMELKSRYVVNHNLYGIMFWELALDAPANGLLQAIHNVKSEKARPRTGTGKKP